MARRISKEEAQNIGDKLHVNFDVIPLDVWQYGLKVEMEHGTNNKRINVTHGDLMATGKIALAHLLEFPDYYHRLHKMEAQANKYWGNNKKPPVVIPENKKKNKN